MMDKETIDRSKSLLELRVFGVCAWFGERLGIRATTIRMYFVYLSFFTFGSPILLYAIFSFILEHKEQLKPWLWPRRRSVWDL